MRTVKTNAKQLELAAKGLLFYITSSFSYELATVEMVQRGNGKFYARNK